MTYKLWTGISLILLAHPVLSHWLTTDQVVQYPHVHASPSSRGASCSFTSTIVVVKHAVLMVTCSIE